MVQAQKKIALLHRYPADRIRETNAAFPYLRDKGIDVLTFKEFDRLDGRRKFFKSLAWIFYAPFLVMGKGYDVIYCDDSFPFYPALVKLASPKSKLVLRIGDFHLMYYVSGFLFHILHFFEKISWRLASEILAISGDMATQINHEIKVRVRKVLDPVDPNDFPIPQNSAFKGHGTVMFHGLLNRNKNIDVLLDAAKLLPEVVFVIVGDGPDRARLESAAPMNVLFKGWVPFYKMNQYIATCSVGVALRSDNPGNDYVVTSPFLQYGVMGKPCLVTKRKVFGNYEWQFTTAREMVDKIKELLTRPEEGQKMRRYILKHHDAKTIAEKIWAILTSL